MHGGNIFQKSVSSHLYDAPQRARARPKLTSHTLRSGRPRAVSVLAACLLCVGCTGRLLHVSCSRCPALYLPAWCCCCPIVEPHSMSISQNMSDAPGSSRSRNVYLTRPRESKGQAPPPFMTVNVEDLEVSAIHLTLLAVLCFVVRRR